MGKNAHTIAIHAVLLFGILILNSCKCQDYGQIECERDEHCDPCSICFERYCEKDKEICWDQVDNDCDGDTDEGCQDVCEGIECDTPPPRECLDDQTLRYYLEPGVCIDGTCRYDFEDVVCQQVCSGNSCEEDPCIGLICDDHNPCTDDGCSSAGDCTNEPNTDPCVDGDPCSHTDRCSLGQCSGVPYSCEDGNDCTDDSCNGDGTCNNDNNTSTCDDGDPCTMNDICSQGSCDGEPLDADSDGYVAQECNGDDCDDSNNLVYPGAEELCDGLDHNCDGLVDMVGTDMCNYEAFCQKRNLLYCQEDPGPTDVQLVIDEDEAWCAKNAPYIHDGTSILAEKVLAVGPCVEIRAEDGTFINVRGHLDVVGDEENPVIFTSNSSDPTRSSWGGINIQMTEFVNGSVSLFGAVVEYAVDGLSVDGCEDRCTVTINGITFQNNEMAVRGYISGDRTLEIKSSKFIGNTCGSNQGNKVFRECQFTGNDKGLCMGEGATVIDCTVTDNVVGLEGGDGSITNSLISNNTEYGVLCYRDGSSASFELEGNTIIDNGIGVLVVDDSGYVAPIHNNVICGNDEYDILMDTSVDLDAANNWWCSTDREFISARIFDVYDDADLGKVVFEPFLSEEP